MTIRTSTIINAAALRWPAAHVPERLQINAGEGYFWMAYDDGADIYLDASVHVAKLNDLTLQQWLEEVADLMDRVFTRQAEVAK